MLKERIGKKLKKCEGGRRERPVSLNGGYVHIQIGTYPICKACSG